MGGGRGYAPRVAIDLSSDDVRAATAALMAFRLRSRSFAAGAGGEQQRDFDATTTPTLESAQEVTERNAALVSDDFPGAEVGDEAELRTIAALRSAIELEASVPAMDRDRILTWREQLREYVKRAIDSTGGGGAGDPPGTETLKAVWNFGPSCPPRAPGSEVPWPPQNPAVYEDPSRARRLRW